MPSRGAFGQLCKTCYSFPEYIYTNVCEAGPGLVLEVDQTLFEESDL